MFVTAYMMIEKQERPTSSKDDTFLKICRVSEGGRIDLQAHKMFEPHLEEENLTFERTQGLGSKCLER